MDLKGAGEMSVPPISSLATAAAAPALGNLFRPRSILANDTVNAALIGSRSMGRGDLDTFFPCTGGPA